MDGRTQGWERNFRERILALREAKGWTQTELAKRLKVDYGLAFHQQMIGRIEAGERPVRLHEAYAIAELLGVDLPSLTDESGGPASTRLGLDVALSRLKKAAQEVAWFALDRWERIEEAQEIVELAWASYESAQRELGLEPDQDIQAKLRLFSTRQKSATHAISDLSALGEM